jgi:hypothetical protein
MNINRFPLICGLVALVGVPLAWARTDPTKTDVGKEPSKETKAFRSLFATCEAPLVVDLREDDKKDGSLEIALPDSSLALPRNPTDAQLNSYAIVLNRKVAHLEDAWVLFQTNRITSGFAANERDIAEWLDRIGLDELKSLATSNRDVRELDGEGQTNILNLVRNYPDLVDRVTSGKSVCARLHYVFVVYGVNTKTGKTVDANILDEAVGPVDLKPDAKGSPSGSPLVAVKDGSLDFGEGEVLSVRDALGRAAKAFGIRFNLDSRILRSRVFIKGCFNEKRFAAAFYKIATVEPLEVVNESAEEYAQRLQKIYDKIWANLADLDQSNSKLAELKKKLLSGDVKMKASEAIGLSKDLQSQFKISNIDLNSIVTIKRDLALRVSAEGDGPAGGSMTTNDIRFLIVVR